MYVCVELIHELDTYIIIKFDFFHLVNKFSFQFNFCKPNSSMYQVRSISN